MKNNLTIKQYYIRKFKDTLPNENMKDDTTFYGLLETIENHKSIDKYLFHKEPNDLIIKRVVALLCEQYEIDYEYLKNFLKRIDK